MERHTLFSTPGRDIQHSGKAVSQLASFKPSDLPRCHPELASRCVLQRIYLFRLSESRRRMAVTRRGEAPITSIGDKVKYFSRDASPVPVRQHGESNIKPTYWNSDFYFGWSGFAPASLHLTFAPLTAGRIRKLPHAGFPRRAPRLAAKPASIPPPLLGCQAG